MSNATISSSGKTPGGTLHSVGGVSYDDYFANLTALFDGNVEDAFDVLDEFRSVLRPAAAGAAPAQQQDHQPREGAGSPPGGAKMCPSHGQAAVHRAGVSKAGKDYAFWKCPVTDAIITDFKGNLKSSCS